MEISCAFPPGPHVVDHIVEAERLGYERAWLFDSPALYSDIWVIAAFAAQRTSRIALGPAVLVPEPPAPAGAGERDRDARAARAGSGRGRDRYRFHRAHGDGAKAAHVGVRRAGTSSSCARCCGARRSRSTVRSCRCCTAPTSRRRSRSTRRSSSPRTGRRASAVAREFGDGIMTIGGGDADFDWCSVLAFGTVLDAGESPGSERALAAAGPALTVVYHAMYEGDPASVEALPGGVEWRKRARGDSRGRTSPRDSRRASRAR